MQITFVEYLLLQPKTYKFDVVLRIKTSFELIINLQILTINIFLFYRNQVKLKLLLIISRFKINSVLYLI